MAGVTGTVAETARTGTNLNVRVILPDGSVSQWFTVSLLSSTIQQDLQAQARQVVNAVNDTLIKQNLALVVKGLSLDLADPAVVTPPGPTADDVAVQTFSDGLQTWLGLRSKLALGLATQAAVDNGAAQLKSFYNNATAAQQTRMDGVLKLVRP